MRQQHKRNTRTVYSHSRKIKIQGHNIIVIMIIKGTSFFFSLTDERDCLSFSLPLLNLNLLVEMSQVFTKYCMCTLYTHTYVPYNIQSETFISSCPISRSHHFTLQLTSSCHPLLHGTHSQSFKQAKSI